MKKFNVSSSVPGITFPSANRRNPAMLSLKKSRLTPIITTLLCLVVVALPHAALADDAAGDFSLGSNPNGVWSYGWSTTLGSVFNLDTSNTNAAFGRSGLSGWLGNQISEGDPMVVHNGTANPIFVPGATTIQPGQLALNPYTNKYAVLRWTAHSPGAFSITATFSGLSSVGDSADVHILLDGASIFSSTVNGSPSPATYSGVRSLVAGDHIDFAVGFGSDGSDHDDMTALAASVVPEPGTLGLVGAGLSCLLSFRFLKRK
jgi:hypothetical protein